MTIQVRLMALGLTVLTLSAQAQTCKTDVLRTANDSRYALQAGGAEVRDRQTGLIWQRCHAGQSWNGSACAGVAGAYSWQGALQAVKNAGNSWRVPDIKELQSLVEEACYAPAINAVIFPGTVSDWTWTSSPVIHLPGYAWMVNFSSGKSYGDLKNATHPVRAVRSAP